MSETTLYTFSTTRDTVRVRCVLDCDYQSEGSYALDTEEETARAVAQERRKLGSGEWVAVGYVAEERCSACGSFRVLDSIWGCVVDNCQQKLREYAGEVADLPEGVSVRGA